MAEKCGDEVDFRDDGNIYVCDREPGHPGRHGFRGAAALLTWGNT